MFIEFLEDLVVESFGFFYIVIFIVYGCVERIIFIYRADYVYERIIRIMNGIIYNFIKNCGVFIIFLVDLEESFRFIFRVFFFGYFYFVFDFLGYLYWDMWKNWFFYFYRYYYLYGWSRYRFVRGWLKV